MLICESRRKTEGQQNPRRKLSFILAFILSIFGLPCQRHARPLAEHLTNYYFCRIESTYAKAMHVTSRGTPSSLCPQLFCLGGLLVKCQCSLCRRCRLVNKTPAWAGTRPPSDCVTKQDSRTRAREALASGGCWRQKHIATYGVTRSSSLSHHLVPPCAHFVTFVSSTLLLLCLQIRDIIIIVTIKHYPIDLNVKPYTRVLIM